MSAAERQFVECRGAAVRRAGVSMYGRGAAVCMSAAGRVSLCMAAGGGEGVEGRGAAVRSGPRSGCLSGGRGAAIR